MRLNTYDLKEELDREMPTPDEWLNERERGIAQRFEQRILELYAGCEKKGGFTAEAFDFYDKYSDDFERNARELFQQALDDIK